jgi:ParB family chromosome partitioning protein
MAVKNLLSGITLTPYEGVFRESGETPILLPVVELVAMHNHPYRVDDDEKMDELVESVRQYGILTPGICRRIPEGGYEIISGHRRRRAAQLAGLESMPMFVKDVDDDGAQIMMVEANRQREHVRPSEKAWAYRVELEAMKRQGSRTDLTSRQLDGKLENAESAEIIGEKSGESASKIHRYIRLTHLVYELIAMVDRHPEPGGISFGVGVLLSYLTDEEQNRLSLIMRSAGAVPTIKQAETLRALSEARELTDDTMLEMFAKPAAAKRSLKLPQGFLREYFPEDYTENQMLETISQLLENWKRRQKRPVASKDNAEKEE